MASEPKVGDVRTVDQLTFFVWIGNDWIAASGDQADRLSALLTEADELKAENERLRFQAEMACEEPVDDCQCAGCLLANERHARGEL